MATRTPRAAAPRRPALAPGQRRRLFPGEERQLTALRRWLSSLLPDCPARDDVLSVATELGSNAIAHTASGRRGGWFAVEVTWHQFVVQVAVADGGGPAEPRVIDDPDADRGRGLLLVRGLSARMGFAGDHRGRMTWAQIAWPGRDAGAGDSSLDARQAAADAGEPAPARQLAGLRAWARAARARSLPGLVLAALALREATGPVHALAQAPGRGPSRPGDEDRPAC